MCDPHTHTPIGNTSTHDLFNELHRRLLSQSDSILMFAIADNLDALHHDFTSHQLALPVGKRI